MAKQPMKTDARGGARPGSGRPKVEPNKQYPVRLRIWEYDALMAIYPDLATAVRNLIPDGVKQAQADQSAQKNN